MICYRVNAILKPAIQDSFGLGESDAGNENGIRTFSIKIVTQYERDIYRRQQLTVRLLHTTRVEMRASDKHEGRRNSPYGEKHELQAYIRWKVVVIDTLNRKSHAAAYAYSLVVSSAYNAPANTFYHTSQNLVFCFSSADLIHAKIPAEQVGVAKDWFGVRSCFVRLVRGNLLDFFSGKRA